MFPSIVVGGAVHSGDRGVEAVLNPRSISIVAAVLTFLVASTSRAANFCLSFGAAHAVASGFVVPTKGTCTSFNGFYSNRAGVLLAGEVCRSSDGTTFLFNLFTQHNSMPDSIAGTWSSSNGQGSGNECTSANCFPFGVAVTKCTNVTIPHNAPGAETESSAGFLSQEQ